MPEIGEKFRFDDGFYRKICEKLSKAIFRKFSDLKDIDAFEVIKDDFDIDLMPIFDIEKYYRISLHDPSFAFLNARN